MRRTPKTGSSSQRRQFIGELAAGAAALAAAACTPAATATNAPSQSPKPATSPPPTEMPSGPMPAPPTTWDASWMNRITAKHKAIFDSPEIGEGTALYHAMTYLGSVKDVFGTGDSDASVVVVLRHRGAAALQRRDVGEVRRGPPACSRRSWRRKPAAVSCGPPDTAAAGGRPA